ncbi:2,3-bisphosphoglycerate-independent phosphoglycerate mutase [Methanocalculus taiwanensis]|uniref:2,3-bisphosphoglycerate-independent phosphoglycerate mutase n=1 Tax=Methanocalculus taiwanensis TaxID=106207 RepID=A0ABD4THV4_9EURY|nr:2,3-bisphosphoglycerate-independent phosphoglycerate mutase [Methanocalculus taiwanensis]MCQ1538519.1 2,3-bisphosphoglycerate-independent phosphoglycerate mutase [Methanocalculus taiwanensis]
MTAQKILLLVLDGIADRPCEVLDGKTPLQAAATPVLDRLAQESVCGIMDTIAPGIRPGSDTAHLSLLGYPPERYYTGRGPLEAEGCGIRMEAGMIGFRGNFGSLDSNGTIIDRRAGRIASTAPFCDAIREGVDLSSFGVELFIEPGAGHRAAVAFRGEGLGANVTSNDPKHEHLPPLPIRPMTDAGSDLHTAEVANEFLRQSQEILFDHPLNKQRIADGLLPANIVLIRGAGIMGRFEPFPEKWKITGSVISAAALISGIGSAVGLEPVQVPGITGSADSDLNAKIAYTEKELDRKDFVLLNIKGADEFGHDGKPLLKRDFIEVIDSALAPLLEWHDIIIAICADHTTPCSVMDHSGDPVPIIIRGPGVRVDSVAAFDELCTAGGGLSRIRGGDLMPILVDLINRSEKYGA